MRVNLDKIKQTEKELIIIRLGQNTVEVGKTIRRMVTEEKNGKMALTMKDSLEMV